MSVNDPKETDDKQSLSKTTSGLLWLGIIVLVFVGVKYFSDKGEDDEVAKVAPLPKLASKPQISEEDTTAYAALPTPDDLDPGLNAMLTRIENILDTCLLPAYSNQYIPKAEKLIAKAKEKYKFPVLNAYEGNLYVIQKQYEQAVDAYRIAYEHINGYDGLTRNFAKACYNAAMVTYDQENITDQCLDYLNEAHELDPADTLIARYYHAWNFRKGYLLLMANENARAIPYLEKSSSVKLDEYVTLFNLGIGYAMTEQSNKAIRIFRKCLKLKPKDPASMQYLYAIYSSIDNKDSAQVFYIKPK